MVWRLGGLVLGWKDGLFGVLVEELHLEQLLDPELIGVDETIVPQLELLLRR
jgi:hypothetical protein